MKLHYFSGSTLPSHYANAVHVMKMCNAFALGCEYEVTLLAKRGAGDVDIYSNYGVGENFKVLLCADSRLPGVASVLRVLRAFSIFKDLEYVYGRDPWSLSVVANTRVPFALELHEIPQSFLQKVIVKRLLKAKNLSGVVVITDGLKQALLSFAPFLSADYILVAPDGADVPSGQIVAKALRVIAGTSSQAGYAGSLYAGKGIELIAQMALSAPHIGFHVFGGPKEELEKWQSVFMPKNIEFYGHVPHRDVQGFLAACDVLIAPYMPQIRIGTGADIGGWISPLKLFEYMAVQRPIICSDLPVLNEVMRDGENCLLVSPDDERAWVSAIDKLSADVSLSRQLSSTAFSVLAEKYSWGVRAKAIARFVFRDKP